MTTQINGGEGAYKNEGCVHGAEGAEGAEDAEDAEGVEISRGTFWAQKQRKNIRHGRREGA